MILKRFGIIAVAAALIAGCDSMQWNGGDKPKVADTKPATMAPATPATPTTPAMTKPTVVVPTPPVTPAAKVAIRVKAGSTANYTDKKGQTWVADMGFDGGETIDRDASLQVSGTDDPALFRSERYSMNGYTFTVPNGKYKVNLYFAETYDGISAIGDRVFSFNVQGKDYKDFDIWKEAGGPNKVKVVSTDVVVTNGKIEIKFTAGVQNPCIDAIEILPS